MSELLQRRSLSEQVYDVLIHDIVTGQIALGDRLINRELQTRFGVSSTPIRDAINKLYQDGLIRELTNSGAQLIDFDQQYAEELNHFIMMLACEALALASQSDQQAEIVRLLHEYQDAMEASIKKGVQGSMGNLLQDMGARGVVNSSVMDTGLKGISDSASDAMAQNWQNTVSQLANIYGQNIDAAGQPIANAAAAQEAAQQPALNLWNASLGLNGATTGALSSLAGKGTTTTTQKTSGGGLFGGILTGLASNSSIFCFAPETKVRLADGSEVPITDVKVGDKVLCPHEDGTESEETVLHTMEPHYSDVWNLVCKDGVDTHYVMATLTQPLLTEDNKFVEISDMTLGTNLKGRGKIVNMVYAGERKVYDLHVSGDNNYYADGFIAKGGSTDNWVKEDN